MFWTARFSTASVAAPEQLRTYWAYQAQGNWEAPESPLRAFASSAALYKLYVTNDAVGRDGEAPSEEDPCGQFLGAFLPELHNVLSQAPQT